MNYLFTFLLVIPFLCTGAYEVSELRCLVCKATTEELQKVIDKEGTKKTVDIGGYQIDGSGNVKKKKKMMVQSEVYLTEVMDGICKRMDDYLRATRKDNGKLVLLSISDLTSSPKLGEVDLIQDSDLNRSLEFHCKGIVEEFEDDFLEVFGRSSKTAVKDICEDSSALCDEGSLKDEL